MLLGSVLSRGMKRSGRRGISSSGRRLGLEEFFDSRNRLTVRENPTAGRAWEASELRRKSFEDLHKLWFVLYKERNVLNTETQRARRHNLRIKASHRKTAVRKSMNRIKQVLSERRAAYRISLQPDDDEATVEEENQEAI